MAASTREKAMQDNTERTGSNWTGRAPRTTAEAFPQYPGPDYAEPSLLDKILDVGMIVLAIGAFGSVAYFGPSLILG